MAPATALKISPEPDDDPVFYPEEEKLGEDVIQSLVAGAFQPLLQRYLDEHGIRAFVGADQLIYYIQGDPSACVSPDVYVMPGVALEDYGRIGCWKKWQIGIVPPFALEIMSLHNKKKKDDRKSPLRHDALGTKELIVFDPYVDELPARIRFRIFRRDQAGRLVMLERTNVRQVWSEALGCYLRVVGTGNFQRLRLATGTDGETLFPTEAEAEARRADEEARRADDAARRANEATRRASDAEAELERLRARLAELERST
jgi:Uma2 family endonuclease